jgi:tetratricopeptide (TPR) repeat protein
MGRPSARFLCSLLAALVACIPARAQQSDAARIYAQSSKSVLLIFLRSADSKITSQGTGFLVEGGKIITNLHVIRDGTPLVDLGGVRIPANVDSVDELNDIAVLTVGAEISAAPLVLADNIPPVGSSVFAIGNPLGLEKTISTGVISGIRTDEKRQLLQITTPVSPGSSGGPVIDAAGKVVGVTVGSIEEGQSLNFAVPASVVIKLLRGQALETADFATLVGIAESHIEKRKNLQYSIEPDSQFQKNEQGIKSAYSAAIERAGKNDVPALLEISDRLSQSLFNEDELALAVSASERAVKFTPSAAAYLSLAKALNIRAMMSRAPATADQQKAFIDRAEKAVRQAMSKAPQPNAEMFFWLGDTLEMRGSHQDSDAALRRALDLNRATSDTEQQARILRDLITVSAALQRQAETDKWFSSLSQIGGAQWWDWKQQAFRLDAARRYTEAGQAWQQAAEFKADWTDWCEAAGSFEFAPGKEDSILYTARQCIALGAGKDKSEGRSSDAHREIAEVLNDRGVYEEALSHSKEAIALNPENAFAYNQEAVALRGLHRYLEAINVAKQAIRLSDGKYGIMHFQLGSAYFETENWQFARQSFQKAAELMPNSDAAAYNVALCFQRLSLFLDAAQWYEEALRRNPNRPDKQDVLKTISILKQ